jgi:hypothetical protein
MEQGTWNMAKDPTLFHVPCSMFLRIRQNFDIQGVKGVTAAVKNTASGIIDTIQALC